jgi:preprotein translocase subunit SecB
VFKLTLDNPEYDLSVNAVHWFEAEKEITEEFKLSDFPSINAPAIAFPFLRAYVSNLTLQSGYEPAILPSLNFVEMAKKKKAKK